MMSRQGRMPLMPRTTRGSFGRRVSAASGATRAGSWWALLLRGRALNSASGVARPPYARGSRDGSSAPSSCRRRLNFGPLGKKKASIDEAASHSIASALEHELIVFRRPSCCCTRRLHPSSDAARQLAVTGDPWSATRLYRCSSQGSHQFAWPFRWRAEPFAAGSRHTLRSRARRARPQAPAVVRRAPGAARPAGRRVRAAVVGLRALAVELHRLVDEMLTIMPGSVVDADPGRPAVIDARALEAVRSARACTRLGRTQCPGPCRIASPPWGSAGTAALALGGTPRRGRSALGEVRVERG